jgi:hypothetical protein
MRDMAGLAAACPATPTSSTLGHSSIKNLTRSRGVEPPSDPAHRGLIAPRLLAKGPLFRTIGRGTGRLARTPLPRSNAHAMIRRRAAGLARGEEAFAADAPRDRNERMRIEGHAMGIDLAGAARVRPARCDQRIVVATGLATPSVADRFSASGSFCGQPPASA